MKVWLEPTRAPNGAFVFQARILDGYREGQLLRESDTENPMYHFSAVLFTSWLQNTGYEVMNPVE